MDTDDIHQPHDKLFKATFSNPVTAGAFLRHHLPVTLSRRLAWTSLHFLPGSFIDEQLRGSEADLLFSVKTQDTPQNGVFLYLLWEHQSSASPLMALRLLSYMVRIWTRQSQDQGGTVTLSAILPVVLAQDKRRWKVSEQFRDLFRLTPEQWEGVGAFTPDFAFRLLQLVEMTYGAIQGTAEGILTLRALKAEAAGELIHEAVWEPGVLAGVSLEAAERFFRYMLNAGIDKESFQRRVQTATSGKVLQQAMTIANQFVQEGLRQGLSQGLSQGLATGELLAQRRILLEVLETRFGGIPKGLRDRVEAIADGARLATLIKRAVLSQSLEEFAKSL